MPSNFTATQSVNNPKFVDTSTESGIFNNFNGTRTTASKRPVNVHNLFFVSIFHIHIEY